jgi:hypothetical protein
VVARCRALTTRAAQDGGGARTGEDEVEENGPCILMLYFSVVRELRPRIGGMYGSSVGDVFLLLQWYFETHFRI